MGRVRVGAPGVEPAVLLDQRELLLGGEGDPVLHRQLVEGAGDRALHARAVVPEDVDDERVVELAHLPDRVEQATDVPVGVLLEAGVDLHLPRVQRLLAVRERVPGREFVRPRREHRVLRDHAQLLLPFEGLLAEHVPALVERAAVLLAPLDRDLVGRVRAPGRVVDEPRLLLVLGAHPVQPAHRLVGEVVRPVVLLAVLALRDAEGRVVLRDHRVVLARLAAEDAPEAVESPGVRPAVERPGRPLHVIGRHVPLSESGGRVAVALKRPDEGSAVLRHARRVAGERSGELADRPEPHGVVVAARQQGGPGGRAERGDVEAVVAEALLGDPRHGRRGNGPAERGRVAEARVVDQDEQHVRRALRGRRRHVDRPVGDRGVERAPDRAAEVRVRDRKPRSVGAELPHRLGERLLQRADALLVALDDRPDQRARERPLDTEPLSVVEDGDDPGRPRRQVLADLVVDLALDPVVGELADDPAGDRADGDRREQRGREEANRKPDPAAPARPLAAEVVARLAHADAAVLLVRHEDDALDRDLLLLDEREERLEVLRRLVDVLVARDEHVGRCLGHHESPFDSMPRGSSGAKVFCRAPPNLTDSRLPAPEQRPQRWAAGPGHGRHAAETTSKIRPRRAFPCPRRTSLGCPRIGPHRLPHGERVEEHDRARNQRPQPGDRGDPSGSAATPTTPAATATLEPRAPRFVALDRTCAQCPVGCPPRQAPSHGL